MIVPIMVPLLPMMTCRCALVPPNLLPHNQVPVQPPVCIQVVYLYHPVLFRRQVRNQVVTL